MEITAGALARVVYALSFLLFYRQRAYYLVFSLIIGVVVGSPGLEYVPALWLPVELIISTAKIFRRA